MTSSNPAYPNRQRAPRAPRVELRGGPSWASDSNYAAVEPVVRPRGTPAPAALDPQDHVAPAPQAGDPVFDNPQAASTPAPAGVRAGSQHTARADNAARPEPAYHDPVFHDHGQPDHGYTDHGHAELPRPHQARADRPARGGRHGENRTLADFERAKRHSQRVALLKVGLPAFAALTMVVILGTLFFAGSKLPSVDIGSTKIEDGKLVMDNPHLNGTDSNQRPYDLSADRAIQDADQPTRIMLEKIKARLPMTDTSFASVTAGTGIYDADGKTLRLGDAVSVDTEDGMSIRMEDAAIDIESGTMSTQNPVSVDTGRAFVSAETLLVEDKGDKIVFENRVRMTIRPPSGDDKAGAIAIPTMPIIGQINSQGKADE